MATYAIGDVHGCYATLRQLVEDVLGLCRHDVLYLLGDYVDKGPWGGRVLDYLMGLQREGYHVVALRGNHEQNLLEAHAQYAPQDFRLYVERLCKNRDLWEPEGGLRQSHRRWLLGLPYWARHADFWLVHAALAAGPDLEPSRYMLEQYRVEASRAELRGMRLVRGHKPQPLRSIRRAIDTGAGVWPIDNGCVYAGRRVKHMDTSDMGHLCAVRLEDGKLWAQANVDTV